MALARSLLAVAVGCLVALAASHHLLGRHPMLVQRGVMAVILGLGVVAASRLWRGDAEEE